MFCPSCGAEYAIELKYCNRCGANLSTAGLQPQPVPVVVNVTKPTLILSALMLLVTLGGFGGLVGGAIALAPVLRGNDSFMAIIMFGMLIILVVDIYLVRLLSKLVNAALTSNAQHPATQSLSAHVPPQFQNPSPTARLQGVPSVTENTTRYFEPYRGSGEQTSPIPIENIKR